MPARARRSAPAWGPRPAGCDRTRTTGPRRRPPSRRRVSNKPTTIATSAPVRRACRDGVIRSSEGVARPGSPSRRAGSAFALAPLNPLRTTVLVAGGLILLVSTALLAWCYLGSAAPTAPAPAAAFVGAQTCAPCHAQEHARWAESDHARAMQAASAATVLGDFADRRFTQGAATSTFFRREGRFMGRAEGPDGTPADFEIKYTFGVRPLQQYLVELPGGRLQALSIAWDSRGREAGGRGW